MKSVKSVKDLNPVYGWLKIEIVERENKGIIATVSQEVYATVKVLAVGSTAGKRDGKVLHEFNVGDHIVVHKGKIQTVVVNGESVLLVSDDGVILA
jgi:co-chaperonin GroES (HSP10)